MAVQLLIAVILISYCGCAVSTTGETCSADVDVLKFSVGAVNATAFSDGVMRVSEKFILVNSIATIRAYEYLHQVPFQFAYHPVLFDTGSMKVLVDPGTGPKGFGAPTIGKLVPEMKKAGIPPESIDAIILSHGHSDHVSGLRAEDDSAVFPNAKVYVPKAEFEFWSADPLVYPSPELFLALPEFGSPGKCLLSFQLPTVLRTNQFYWIHLPSYPLTPQKSLRRTS